MNGRSRAFGLENMWASHVLRTILTQIGRFFRNSCRLNREGRTENWRLQASEVFIYSYLFVPVGKEENNKLTSGSKFQLFSVFTLHISLNELTWRQVSLAEKTFVLRNHIKTKHFHCDSCRINQKELFSPFGCAFLQMVNLPLRFQFSCLSSLNLHFYWPSLSMRLLVVLNMFVFIYYRDHILC